MVGADPIWLMELTKSCKSLARRLPKPQCWVMRAAGETEARRCSGRLEDANRGSPCQGYAAINDALILLAVH